VVLILDLRGVARSVELPPIDRAAEESVVVAAAAADRYLVCRTWRGRRVALPLGEIVRLEKHRGGDIQAAGLRRLIRRGDGFTPLADVDRLLGAAPSPVEAAAAEALNVVVVRGPVHDLGLAVERILDVVAADAPLQASLSAPGVAGTVSLGGLATEVIDVAAAVAD